VLPSELPDVPENLAVDADLGGNEYGILFLRDSPDDVAARYVHATAFGMLKASPKSEEKASENVEASTVEAVGLPDGTEVTFRYMEPVR
jgi:hypothetical protein